MLFCGPFYCFHRGLIIKQPVTFDKVKGFSVGRAEPVDHGKPSDLDAHGIYHQFVALIMANGIPIPRRRHLRWMRLIHAYLTELMIKGVKDSDLVRLLKHLHSTIYRNE